MEAEKKPKRPRIGAPSAGASEVGETENRYEKVNYPNDYRQPGDRPQTRAYGDRQQGYQQRPYGSPFIDVRTFDLSNKRPPTS